jgi:hypothetical protein
LGIQEATCNFEFYSIIAGSQAASWMSQQRKEILLHLSVKSPKLVNVFIEASRN